MAPFSNYNDGPQRPPKTSSFLPSKCPTPSTASPLFHTTAAMLLPGNIPKPSRRRAISQATASVFFLFVFFFDSWNGRCGPTHSSGPLVVRAHKKSAARNGIFLFLFSSSTAASDDFVQSTSQMCWTSSDRREPVLYCLTSRRYGNIRPWVGLIKQLQRQAGSLQPTIRLCQGWTKNDKPDQRIGQIMEQPIELGQSMASTLKQRQSTDRECPYDDPWP